MINNDVSKVTSLLTLQLSAGLRQQLVVLMTMCCSCRSDVSYQNDVTCYKQNSTIYYYNYDANSTAPLCAKKHCTHNNTGCDFYEVLKIIEDGNKVYFLRDEGYEVMNGTSTLKQSICVYDKAIREVQTLYSVNATKDDCINFHMEIYEDWLYFYRGVTIDATHKDCTLYRLNLLDGSVQKLFDSEYVHAFVYQDMLVYNNLDGGIYTTYIYGNFITYIVNNINGLHMLKSNYSSDYAYYNVYNVDRQQYDLHRCHIIKHDTEMVAQNVPESLYYGVVLIDDKLYYYEPTCDSSTKIYSCYHDGTNKKLLIEMNYEILQLDVMKETLIVTYKDAFGITRRTIINEENSSDNAAM